MIGMNQAVGTTKAYLSSNNGVTVEWPILEKADGSMTVDPKLMSEGFPYEVEMCGRFLLLVRTGDGVDIWEEGKDA